MAMSLKSIPNPKNTKPAFRVSRNSNSISFQSSKEVSRELSQLEKSFQPAKVTSNRPSLQRNSNPSQATKIQVTCRIRPKLENEQKERECLSIVDEKTIAFDNSHLDQNIGASVFTFDRVFSKEAEQQEIYDFVAKPILEGALEGYNGTILAYGIAHTGKTFTINGTNSPKSNLQGISPRLINGLFEFIRNSPESSKYSVKFSYIELHDKKIKDLMNPTAALKLREHRIRGVCIDGLTEIPASKEEDILTQLKVAEKNKLASLPSKSHYIFMVSIRQTDKNNESNIKVSKLYLADLAGAEKAIRDKDGRRQNTTNKNIIQSLSALGSVINVLSEGKSHKPVPYRYSNLTRILKDSLGGSSKTSLIITCSPCLSDEHETLNTLKFGSRAKLVRNLPKIRTELTMPQLEKRLSKAEKELDHKSRRIQALENLLKENGLEIPIDTRTDTSGIDSMSDTNFPSMIGDFESHLGSEIYDREDYTSNRSILDFSNIHDEEESLQEEEGEDTKDRDIENDDTDAELEDALCRIKELEAALAYEKKSVRTQLDKVNLLRKELVTKDGELEKKNEQVHALYMKMEFLKIKIEGMEEDFEEKNLQMKELEELRDKLIKENEYILKVNTAFDKKMRVGQEYLDNLSSILNSKMKESEFNPNEIQELRKSLKDNNFMVDILSLQQENKNLNERMEAVQEENTQLKQKYEELLKNYQEEVSNKFPNFEEVAKNMVTASLYLEKASYEKEKKGLQKNLQQKIDKIFELEKELDKEKSKQVAGKQIEEKKQVIEHCEESPPRKHPAKEGNSQKVRNELLTPSEKPQQKKGKNGTIDIQKNKLNTDNKQIIKNVTRNISQSNKIERKIDFSQESSQN